VVLLFDLGEPFIFRSFSLHHRIIAMDCIARSPLRSVIVCFAWGLDRLSLARLPPSLLLASPVICSFIGFTRSRFSKLAEASRYLGSITY
jgi:hypothetical protein